MTNEQIKPLHQALGESLVLRTAATKEEVERVAQFDGLIHGSGVTSMTLDIYLRHPHTQWRDLVYVEDTHTNQVVSSLCLIPWTLSYAGVNLRSGEMGIVGTLEPYRKRGLIRAQVEVFKSLLRDAGCMLSHIQGIGYYYRQFGYEYAMPLDGGLKLTRREVPKLAETQYTFRKATEGDLPVLMALFDTAGRELTIHSQRDEATWRYLLMDHAQSEMACETWVVLDAQQQVVSYFRLPDHHFGEELTVNEASRFSFDAAWATLQHISLIAEERHTPGVRLCLPPGCDMMRVARSFGAFDMGTYAWQIYIPDRVTLLRTIGPALERRVQHSIFAGCTRNLTLSFFRQTIRLSFISGKLTQVTDQEFNEEADAHIPPLAFVPLVLGYRSFDEQHKAYPEMGVSAKQRLFVETLFPHCSSFLYTNY
ncbi:MAG TPA: GNAT family N-acetyltransferase [Anaerolineae bacterium]